MRKTTILLAAVAAIVAGCGSDDAPGTGDNPQPEVPGAAAGAAVTVNVGVGDMETRAGHSSSELPDKFILNFDATAEGGNKYDNVTMTRDASTGQYTPSVAMEWGTESRETFVRAWTEPVAVSSSSYYSSIMCVAADQSTEKDIRKSDFLCATTGLGSGDNECVTINGDELNITFLHVFSKINIRCHLGNELTLRYPDAKVSKVEIDGVYRGHPFNFENGSPALVDNDYLTDKGAVTAYLNGPEATTGDVIAEAIMVPQYFVYDLLVPTNPDTRATLTVTLVNGNGVEKTMPAVKITTGSFLAGKRYTMTVNIGDDSVTAGEVTVQPWTEGSSWTTETE